MHVASRASRHRPDKYVAAPIAYDSPTHSLPRGELYIYHLVQRSAKTRRAAQGQINAFLLLPYLFFNEQIFFQPVSTTISPTFLWHLLRHEKHCDLTCFETIWIIGAKPYKELFAKAKVQ